MMEEEIIKGRGWHYGLLNVLLIAPGVFLILVGIDTGYWNVITFGLLMVLAFLPFAVYALWPKKFVFNMYGVSFWFGRKRKFAVSWPYIIELSNGGAANAYMKIKTGYETFSIESVLFSRAKMIEVFNILVEGTQYNQNIEVDDDLHWLRG